MSGRTIIDNKYSNNAFQIHMAERVLALQSHHYDFCKHFENFPSGIAFRASGSIPVI